MSFQFESELGPGPISWSRESSTVSMEELSTNLTNDSYDDSTEAFAYPEDQGIFEFIRILTEIVIPVVFAVIGVVGLTGTELVYCIVVLYCVTYVYISATPME